MSGGTTADDDDDDQWWWWRWWWWEVVLLQPARKWLTESPSQIHHFYTQKPFLTAILGTQPIMATVMMVMMRTPMVMIMMIVLSQVVPGTQCSQSNAHDAEAHISRNCTWSVTIIFCKCVPFIWMRCTRLGTSSTKKNGKMWEFFPSWGLCTLLKMYSSWNRYTRSVTIILVMLYQCTFHLGTGVPN